MKCIQCGTETANAKFCSRSCAAKTNNRTTQKRKAKKTLTCHDCGKVYLQQRWRRSRCPKCYHTWQTRASHSTLGALKTKTIEKGYHPSARWPEVRNHCRNQANKHRPKVCQFCGYDLHVEFCHIKPLSTFSDDATVEEVNDPSNVLILCKNHHWEFDHGHLKIVDGVLIRGALSR